MFLYPRYEENRSIREREREREEEEAGSATQRNTPHHIVITALTRHAIAQAEAKQSKKTAEPREGTESIRGAASAQESKVYYSNHHQQHPSSSNC